MVVNNLPYGPEMASLMEKLANHRKIILNCMEQFTEHLDSKKYIIEYDGNSTFIIMRRGCKDIITIDKRKSRDGQTSRLFMEITGGMSVTSFEFSNAIDIVKFIKSSMMWTGTMATSY